jgi:hypothetical protein
MTTELKGKPRLFRGPASAAASHNEIIQEFGCGKTQGDSAGGLLALRNMGDHLRVEIYRVDGPVRVLVDHDLLLARPAVNARLLEALAIAEGIVHHAVDNGAPVEAHLAMIRAAIADAKQEDDA